MVIHCEINLFKPMDGVYKPGTMVSGSIKYAADKAMEFTRITVSLKGAALLKMDNGQTVNCGSDPQSQIIRHKNKEIIIDDDIVVKGESFTMNVGSEEMHFHFKLPLNIPPTLMYAGHKGNEKIYCNILYYVRIKFDRPVLLRRAKRFKKEIPVAPGIIPVLSREPVIYEEKKTLTNIFSCTNQVVNIKAVIQDSVIETGGKVRFNCEVENLTKIKINTLEIKLLEECTIMKNKNDHLAIIENVRHTESKTFSIKAGKKETFDFIIDVPSDKFSLEHSKIIFRKYFVGILAKLPIPHKSIAFRIPLQIGDILESEMHLVPMLMTSDVNVEAGASSSEQPPTYWEAMVEEKADFFANFKGEDEI